MKKVVSLLLGFITFGGAFAQQSEGESGAIVASGFHITRPLREIFAENPVPDDFTPVRGESKDRLHREPPKYEFTAEDGTAYGNDEATLQKS
jgi:hypothetical protein